MSQEIPGYLPAPIFDDATEARRQAILAELEFLDANEANEFDDLVAIVAEVLQIPVVAVSLIDGDRQQFIAAHGTTVRETPRAISFCGHAIASDETFCIEDATLDARFSTNPMVAEEPHIRFYAGIPLVTSDGSRIGTLCAIDTKPHHPTPERLQMLRSQAGLVLRLLEARRTTRRLAENAMEIADKGKAIERSQAMVRDLSDALSHDLSAPVRHIVAFTRRLARKLPDGDADVEMVLSAANQMGTLIAALRDYGRAGGIVELTDVDARRCADLAILALGHDIQEAGATVTVGPMVQVLGHGAFLTQVFQNLVENALKYADTARPPTIHIACADTDDGLVKFTVADNGLGIDTRYHVEVFERLRRLHLNHVIPGSGLGLTLCKRVIERFGGEIGLESKVGVGTTVWFTLYRA